MRRLPAVLLVALGLAACALPGSLAGRSEAELRARMGPPKAEYSNPDGSRTLAYTTGYMGTQTYMAEVTAGGQVRVVRSVLTDDTFNAIAPGMNRDQVLRLIGPPRDAMTFPRQGQDSWEYYFQDTWGYPALFYVNFDPNGVVVSKLTRRIESSRNERH